MNRISNIFSLILIWLLCSADGCNDNVNITEMRAERQIEATKDSIKQVFEVAYLSDKLLRAYEENAKQKLIDFADYLKIASDSSLDIAFRQKATEMAGKLFISSRTDFTNWSKTYLEPGVKTVDSLLEISFSRGMSFWMQPVQITVQKPLKMKNDTIYEGNISFYLQRLSFEKQNSADNIDELLHMDIYAIKRLKPFGKEALYVWEICLGDVKTDIGQ